MVVARKKIVHTMITENSAINVLRKNRNYKPRRVFFSPKFTVPAQKRTPKQLPVVKSVKPANTMDDFDLLKLPLTTEKALSKIEMNVVTWMVDLRATKPRIAAALTRRFGVKVQKVNTLITPRGEKKAYVRLDKSSDASELYSKLGLL